MGKDIEARSPKRFELNTSQFATIMSVKDGVVSWGYLNKDRMVNLDDMPCCDETLSGTSGYNYTNF
jgi:hypothetical protein